MNLKKIHPELQKALLDIGLDQANEMQEETFSTIKSGADAVIQSQAGTGKKIGRASCRERVWSDV